MTALWLLPFYPSPLRDDGYDISDYRQVHPSLRHACATSAPFLREAHRRRTPGDHRARARPHLRPAPLVPAGPTAPSRISSYRDFYVWSDTPDRFPDARVIFKDFETSNWTFDPVARRLLLAPLLLPPAEPQLRQPRRAPGDVRRRRLLARDGRRRAAPRRRALPLRARGHDLREPARDLRLPARAARPRRRALRRPDAAGRGQPVARGRRRPTWATATSARWPSTSRSCRGCSWPPARRTGSRSSTSWPRPRASPPTASGRCSCATTTS